VALSLGLGVPVSHNNETCETGCFAKHKISRNGQFVSRNIETRFASRFAKHKAKRVSLETLLGTGGKDVSEALKISFAPLEQVGLCAMRSSAPTQALIMRTNKYCIYVHYTVYYKTLPYLMQLTVNLSLINRKRTS
jgi:hypothetical protein